MANVLTGLIPTLYEALDVVSREMTGFVPAVARNTSAERAALNQSITVPITPAATLITNTPAVASPDSGDQTIGSTEIKITKTRSAVIRWNGEEQQGMLNAGTYNDVLRQQFEQGFRAIINEMEADLFAAAYKGASRAYGTAATAPFGTAADLSDAANLRKILDDNGAPQSDLHLVLGSAAVVNLRGKQTILLKANEEGDNTFRRTGAISAVPLDGFMLHNSNAVQAVTKGTGASYVTSGSTAVGVNQIALVTGTGTVLAGDVVTFAIDGTTNKYVVNTGVAAPGTITIGSPGARVVIPTANALTVGATYTPNVGFHRQAIQLVTRAPKRPTVNGQPMDAAVDAMLITDPVSGITFEVAVYPQYRQVQYQIGLAWGCAAVKPDHIATLIG